MYICFVKKVLTPKRAIFCIEYLKDLNGAKAAVRAGYSPKTADSIASELLRKPEVKAEIARLMAERAKRCEVDIDMVLKEFMAIGFSRITDFLKVEEYEEEGLGINPETKEMETVRVKRQRVRIFDTDTIDSERIKAVAEIEQTKTGIRVKLHDKKGALQDIAKHIGFYKNDNEQANKIVIQPTPEELKASRDKLQNDY